MDINQSSHRDITKADNNPIRINLPSQKNTSELIWFLFILVFGSFPTFAFADIFYGFMNSRRKGYHIDALDVFLNILLTGYLIALILCWIMVLYAVFWRLFGEEVIEIHSDSLIIIRKIFWVNGSKEFLKEKISDVRIHQFDEADNAFVVSTKKLLGQYGTIAFDENGKTYHFGFDVEESEALQIIKTIKRVME